MKLNSLVPRPVYRTLAALRWGSSALNRSPAVLGNTMAKSGSNLIIQVLQALPKVGPFIDTHARKINRGEHNSKLAIADTARIIDCLYSGEIAYANILAHDEYVSRMIRPGRATIYMYRDPRDLVVSHVFYVTDINQTHILHQYITHELQTVDERINAFIEGCKIPGLEFGSVRERYESYENWMIHPEVLSIRFEDMILERRDTLSKILVYLEERGFTPVLPMEKSIDILEQGILPKKSTTFRRGKPGNWEEHFTEANKDLFKKVAGNLLIELGYENSNDW